MPHTVECLGHVQSNNSSFTERINDMRPLISNERKKVPCRPTRATSRLMVIDQRVKLQKTQNMPFDIEEVIAIGM